MNELVLYDDKYNLKPYELVFIQNFKDTHNLDKSLKLLTKAQGNNVNASLRTGKSDLAKCFRDFIESAPSHPEANKVVILDNLIWVMNQSKKDLDTNGVIRAIAEINKMIKGNLVNLSDKKVVEKQIIGIIDLSKREEETIDIESIQIS